MGVCPAWEVPLADAEPRRATAVAPSNIALLKYWGKRDVRLNVPETGSISVTLAGLETQTTVAFDDALAEDRVVGTGLDTPTARSRIVAFLDLVRERFGVTAHAQVRTESNFPVGAGLASSASGFAALTLACDGALGLGLEVSELSALARRGSGSAARSFFDGFAEMDPGSRADGSDAFAHALGPPELLPVEILVAVVSEQAKAVGSTEGMARTAATSPFYRAWLDAARDGLPRLRDALLAGDLATVGPLAEESAMAMHAAMLSSRPPLLYWRGATVEVVRRVAALRDMGLGAWVTIDAGPQVKVLTEPAHADTVAQSLAEVEGVSRVLRSRPGPGARRVEPRVAGEGA